MAIKGSIKKELTSETIFKEIDDYNIIKYYLGTDFDFKKSYHSPFRKDNDPNLRFFVNDEGRILWKDFANGMNGDAITFVMKLHGLNYNEALVRIDNDLGLGIRSPAKFKVSIVRRPLPFTKEEKLIQVETVMYDSKNMKYWDRYFIDSIELFDNKIHPIKKLWINKQLIPETHGQRYAYEYGNCLKILSPYDPNYKWISNTPNNYISGLDEIKKKVSKAVNKRKKLIISKSKKDEIILKKFYTDVVSTQNESTSAIIEEDIKFMLENYEEVWLWWDFDAPGIENAEKFSHIFNIVRDPNDVFIGHKDPSDLIKWTNLQITEDKCYQLLRP